ncbi:enoyl-CoA hydratase-related protein [Marinobacter sp. F4218]|uniref:enoyl-CoA hydratase-related protein n=1 Tax=Marinobacter sp. F4218 TaxID=2862868 RepID=UPI001C631ED5|nr:enoyl-CoA hydratase-related protein [Marinobacter sp. F4218]MBW7472138.1 enoyl-CoA hydratase/isomerase family protein [Marinobacter sp. F4218]
MTTLPVTPAFNEKTGVATLTFNRPEVLNAIDVPMAQAFHHAVKDLAGKPGLRCVVLTGAGRAFMAGGDVASMSGSPVQTREAVNGMLDALIPAILKLRAMDAPVIAGVKGAAAGAGLSLALMADLIVAEESARFLIAYNGIGTVPDCGGTWFLPHKIGSARATEMMMLGRTLTAIEAKQWGLVTEVSPQGEFDKTLAAVVHRVANGPTKAFGAFRRLVDDASGSPLEAHLEAERQAFLKATESADFAEGVSAFLAKRPAAFSGK